MPAIISYSLSITDRLANTTVNTIRQPENHKINTSATKQQD